MMNYRDAITESMKILAKDEKTVFLGYNVINGSRGYKTLKDIPREKLLETPVAENLMIGLATGLSLEGYKPILLFERHDFMMNAFDALVNHLDKLEEITEGDFKPRVLIRAVVGRTKPINPGPQHRQDFTDFFKAHLNMKVYDPKNGEEVLELYQELKNFKENALVVERSELYNN